MKGHAVLQQEIPLKNLGGGVQRRVLSYNEDMVIVVAFETGAISAVHTHPHTQCTYVLSGCFSYSVEDKAVVLESGDSIVVASGLSHGTVCLEKGYYWIFSRRC